MKNHYTRILFPIHLYHTHIRENSVIQREVLSSIQKCYEDKNLDIPDGWLTDSLITSFNRDEINDRIFDSNNQLHQIYQKYLIQIFDKKVEFELQDMWFNYYIDGEYQEEHHHVMSNNLSGSSHFSCVHYLKFDESVHNSTVFSDPLELIRAHSFEMDSNRYSNRWQPKVKEGDLLVFPSYLQHHVQKSEPTPDNPRITIAFNLRMISYGECRD